jgi:lysophospholipase L1-like esterase
VGRSLGTLGDLFPADRNIQCCVRGCKSLVNFPGGETISPEAANDPDRPKDMCNACYEAYRQTADRQMGCSASGCSGTWTWPRMAQLEARADGRREPPARLCEACLAKRKQLQDRQVPCRLKGCKNSFTWTKEEQWQDGADKPPARFCNDCFSKLRQLQDRELPCRIPGCKGSWVWPRFQQLEHLASGRPLDPPPRRMCRDCAEKTQVLNDAELPCRVKNCKGTWTFTKFLQLETLLSRGPEEPVQARMCPDCFKLFNSVQDQKVPCRHRGCPNSWTYNRQMQLQDRAAGRHQPPARLCPACAEKIKQTPDLQVPCSVPGCKGTWTWPAADQVRDAVAGKREPPRDRRCPGCEKFLSETLPKTIVCAKCGSSSDLTAYEQLLQKTGSFAESTRCSACAKQELDLRRPAEPPIQRQGHHVVRMPAAGGPWTREAAIANWPPHVNHDTITAAETADIRIVVLGDDLTWSGENPADAWPALLEQKLNQMLEGKAKAAVVNAGIPKTNSHLGAVRIPRDVTPFAPHLVIFSFAYGDACIEFNPDTDQARRLIPAEAAQNGMAELVNTLKRAKTRLLYWTPNPVLPHDTLAPQEHDTPRVTWANEQEAAYNQAQAHATHLAQKAGIPVLDLRTRFEINGKKSARKWMADWLNPNHEGANNIAAWMAEVILREKLVPVPEAPAVE